MYRRHVLGGLELGWLAMTSPKVSYADEHGKSSLSTDEAMKRLMDGNRHFVDGSFINPDVSEKRRRELQSSQSPYASILGCSDSRVPPEDVFDAGLGDLFTDRVAGNIVSEAMLGSILMRQCSVGSGASPNEARRRLGGIVAPNPGAPRDWRASFLDRGAARAAFNRVPAWPIERVLTAHGDLPTHGGAAFVRRAFAWLLGHPSDGPTMTDLS